MRRGHAAGEGMVYHMALGYPCPAPGKLPPLDTGHPTQQATPGTGGGEGESTDTADAAVDMKPSGPHPSIHNSAPTATTGTPLAHFAQEGPITATAQAPRAKPSLQRRHGSSGKVSHAPGTGKPPPFASPPLRKTHAPPLPATTTPAAASTSTPTSQHPPLSDVPSQPPRGGALKSLKPPVLDADSGRLKPMAHVGHDEAPDIIKKPYDARSRAIKKLATVERVFDAYARGANRRWMQVENTLESREKQETRKAKLEEDAAQRLRDAAVKLKMAEWEAGRERAWQAESIKRDEAEQRKLIREQERSEKLPIEAFWERVTTRWLVKQERQERAAVRKQRQLERLERTRVLTSELGENETERREVLVQEEQRQFLWLQRERVYRAEGTRRVCVVNDSRADLASIVVAFDKEITAITAHAKQIADMEEQQGLERGMTLFEEDSRRKNIMECQSIGFEGLANACQAGMLELTDMMLARERERKAAHARQLDEMRQALLQIQHKEGAARSNLDDEQRDTRDKIAVVAQADYAVALKKHRANLERLMVKIRAMHAEERVRFEYEEIRVRERLEQEEERHSGFVVAWLDEMNDYATRPFRLQCPSADLIKAFVPNLSGMPLIDVLFRFESLYAPSPLGKRLSRWERAQLLASHAASNNINSAGGSDVDADATPPTVPHAQRRLSDADGGGLRIERTQSTASYHSLAAVAAAVATPEVDPRYDTSVVEWWPSPMTPGYNHNVFVLAGPPVAVYSDLEFTMRLFDADTTSSVPPRPGTPPPTTPRGAGASPALAAQRPPPSPEPPRVPLTGTIRVRVALVHGMAEQDFLTFRAPTVKGFYEDAAYKYRYVPMEGLYYMDGDTVLCVGDNMPVWDPDTWSIEYTLDLGTGFDAAMDDPDTADAAFKPVTEFVKTVAFKSEKPIEARGGQRSVRMMLEVSFAAENNTWVDFYAPCTMCITPPPLLLDHPRRPTADVAFFNHPKGQEEAGPVPLFSSDFLTTLCHDRIAAKDMFKNATFSVKFTSEYVAEGDRLAIGKFPGVALANKKGLVTVHGHDILRVSDPSRCPFFSTTQPFVQGKEVEFDILAVTKTLRPVGGKKRGKDAGGGASSPQGLGVVDHLARSARGVSPGPGSPRKGRLEEVAEPAEARDVITRLQLVLMAMTFYSTSLEIPRRDILIEARSPYLSVPIFSFEVSVKYVGDAVYLMQALPGAGDVSVSFVTPPSGVAKGYEDLFTPAARVFPKVCIQTSWDKDQLPAGSRVTVTLPKGTARDHLLLIPPPTYTLTDRGSGVLPGPPAAVAPQGQASDAMSGSVKSQPLSRKQTMASITRLASNSTAGGGGGGGQVSTFHTIQQETLRPNGSVRATHIGVLSVTDNTGAPQLVVEFESEVPTTVVEDLIRGISYRCDTRMKSKTPEPGLPAVLVLEHRPWGGASGGGLVSPPALVLRGAPRVSRAVVSPPTLADTPHATAKFPPLSIKQTIVIRSPLFDVPVHCVQQDYKEGQGLRRLATFETECDGTQADDFIYKGQIVCEVRNSLPEDKFKLILPKHSDFVMNTVDNKGFVTVGDRQIGWFYNSEKACCGHLVFEIAPKKAQGPVSIKKDIMGLMKHINYLNESRDPDPTRIVTVSLRGDTGMSQVCMQINVTAVNDPTVVEVPTPTLNYVPNIKKVYPGKLIAENAVLTDPDTKYVVQGGSMTIESAGGYVAGDSFAFLTREQQAHVYPDAKHVIEVTDNGRGLTIDKHWTAVVAANTSAHEKNFTVKLTGIPRDEPMPLSAGAYIISCVTYQSSAPTPKPGKRSFYVKFNAGDGPATEHKTKITLHVLQPLLYTPTVKLAYQEGSGLLSIGQKMQSGSYTPSTHFRACCIWLEFASGFREGEDRLTFAVAKGCEFNVRDTNVFLKGSKVPIATIAKDDTGRRVGLTCTEDKLKGTGSRLAQLFKCMQYENVSRDPSDEPRGLRAGLTVDGDTAEVDIPLEVIPIDDMTEIATKHTQLYCVAGAPDPRFCFEGAVVSDADTPVFFAPKSYLKVEASLSAEHECVTLRAGADGSVGIRPTDTKDVFNVEVNGSYCGRMIPRKKGGFHVELDACTLEDLGMIVRSIVYQSKPSAVQVFRRPMVRPVTLIIRGGPHVQPTKVNMPVNIIPAYLEVDAKRDKAVRPVPMHTESINLVATSGLRFVPPMVPFPQPVDTLLAVFEGVTDDHPFIFVFEDAPANKQFTIRATGGADSDGSIAEVREGTDVVAKVLGTLLPDALDRPCTDTVIVKFLVATSKKRKPDGGGVEAQAKAHVQRVNAVLQMIGVLHREEPLTPATLQSDDARVRVTLSSEGDPHLASSVSIKAKAAEHAFNMF